MTAEERIIQQNEEILALLKGMSLTQRPAPPPPPLRDRNESRLMTESELISIINSSDPLGAIRAREARIREEKRRRR